MHRSVIRLLRNAGRAIGIQQLPPHYPPPHHHHHQHLHHSHVLSPSRFIMPSSHRGRFCNSSTHAAPACESLTEPHSGSSPTPTALSNQEARKLLKLLKIEDFKKHLLSTGNHCMPIEEVLKLCKQTGVAITDADAEEATKHLDEAGVILIFRNRVFFEPEKVAELLAKTMPFHLVREDDPRNEELGQLEKEKEEIDSIAHRQVRNMLWGALAAFSMQSLLFFRLTFWDLSWDVMEPITFFVTSSSLLVGFFFFVLTHRDPSYHDFMNMLLSNKQKKLMKKRNFNEERFRELQVQCCMSSPGKHLHAKH